MKSWNAPSCWMSVEDFVQQINRVVESGVVLDDRLMLQIMRVIYDRAENDPGYCAGIDMAACGDAIIQLEKEIGEE